MITQKTTQLPSDLSYHGVVFYSVLCRKLNTPSTARRTQFTRHHFRDQQSFEVQQSVFQIWKRTTFSLNTKGSCWLWLGSVQHKECAPLNPRLTLSTVKCSGSGRLPGGAGALLVAHLRSEMHAVSTADARGVQEQWTSLPALNSPFLFALPSTVLLPSPPSLLSAPLSVFIPLPLFPPSFM